MYALHAWVLLCIRQMDIQLICDENIAAEHRKFEFEREEESGYSRYVRLKIT